MRAMPWCFKGILLRAVGEDIPSTLDSPPSSCGKLPSLREIMTMLSIASRRSEIAAEPGLEWWGHAHHHAVS